MQLAAAAAAVAKRLSILIANGLSIRCRFVIDAHSTTTATTAI